MDRLSKIFTATTLLASAVTAQRTWVVDQNGGGNFTQIQPAIDVAASGDTILVRGGNYGGFSLTSKGLAIIGDGNVRVFTQVQRSWFGATIRDIRFGQRVVVRGITVPQGFGFGTGILVSSNGGELHLDQVQAATISIAGVTQTTLHRVTSAHTILDRTTAALSECSFGPGGIRGSLECRQAQVTVSGGSVVGARGLFTGTAISLVGGRLTLTGDSQTVIRAGSSPPSSAVAVSQGIAYIDPAVSLRPSGGAPAVSGPSVTRLIPSIRASVTNNRLTTRLTAPGALRGHTLLSLPIRSVQLPLALGPAGLWIAPTHFVLDTGTMPTSGVRTTTTNLPTRQPGLLITLQALIARPNGLELSAPVTLTLDS